jgi:photosystem II stability/assembly factor-like uncharacterized protein
MTSDAGKTFKKLPPPTPQIGAKGWITTNIRFADAANGWAYGGGPEAALYTTADGGRSWLAVDQLPGSVVDLVAANGKAWAIVYTTPYNTTAVAAFALYSTVYGKGTQHWAKVALPVDLGMATPSIVDQDGQVTVLASGPVRNSNKDHALISVDGSTFTDHPGPCSQDLGGYLSNSAKAIWATCPTGHAGGLSVSTDRGATWRAVSYPSPLPATGPAKVGAIDDGHAVVNDQSAGLVLVSTDAAPVNVTPSAAGSVTIATFIGFTTPSVGFFIGPGNPTDPRNPTDQLWRTADGGLHWTVVDLGS